MSDDTFRPNVIKCDLAANKGQMVGPINQAQSPGLALDSQKPLERSLSAPGMASRELPDALVWPDRRAPISLP